MKRHVKATLISMEDYLSKEILKVNIPQGGNILCELIDHFPLLSQCEHLNDLKMEGKIMTKITQSPKHTTTDHPGDIKQGSNIQNELMRAHHTNTCLRNFQLDRIKMNHQETR